jgi:hypothetical protein
MKDEGSENEPKQLFLHPYNSHHKKGNEPMNYGFPPSLLSDFSGQLNIKIIRWGFPALPKTIFQRNPPKKIDETTHQKFNDSYDNSFIW